MKTETFNRVMAVAVVAILGVSVYSIINVNSRYPEEDQTEFIFKPFDGREILDKSQKVVSYAIIFPVVNESKGYLTIKTADGGKAETRITTVQAAALVPLLKEDGIRYNLETKSLIFVSKVESSPELDLMILNF